MELLGSAPAVLELKTHAIMQGLIDGSTAEVSFVSHFFP